MGLAIAASGCVKGSKGLSGEDKDRLKAYVLESEPTGITHKLDVNFEDKIHLIGWKAEPELAKPGTDIKITYFWRCDDKIEDGWLIFTHLQDDVSGAKANLDWNGPIREEKKKGEQILGPSRWEKGHYYIDEMTYKVPDQFTGPEIAMYSGIWKGEGRLRIIGNGPHDGDNRAIVGKIKTGNAPPQPHSMDVPAFTAVKLAATDKIVIDGKADDKAWGAAAATGPFVDVGTGKPNPISGVDGSAKVTWDDQNVYFFFDVKSPAFYTGFTDAKSQPSDFTATGQPKLWTKDTIEIMVDPDGDGDAKDYYEIQINPQNKVFKSQFDTKQQPAGADKDKGPFGHEDWDAKIKSATVINKGPDGKTTGYSVEAAIPWASFSKAQNHPPKPGDTWRVNFYAMKNNGGMAWSPMLGMGNFHTAQRFGKITWALTAAPTTAPATSAVAVGAKPATSSSAAVAVAPAAKAAPPGTTPAPQNAAAKTK